MKFLKFVGYSDDTFACEGEGIDVDFDTCASGKPVYMRVQSGEDALIVTGQYAAGPNAGWMIGVAPADFGREERHVPDWALALAPGEREYSPTLHMEAPDDVKVWLVDEKGKELSE